MIASGTVASSIPRAISLAALTVLELSPPDAISAAADAGYTHVGLRLIPATPEEVWHDIIGNTPLVRETLARLAGTGVRTLDVEVFRLKPDTRVDDYRAAVGPASAGLGKGAGSKPSEGGPTFALAQ